ncbi:hypothetical protein ACLB1G_16035 [Oxalobacteraceae bacterium A2-2]
MQKSLIAAVFALSAIAAGAHAAPQSANEPIQGSVQIKRAPGYDMTKAEFLDYAYSYRLENGQVVEFTEDSGRYFAQLRSKNMAYNRVEIFPVDASTFVTSSGARIAFRDEGSTVGVSNFERLPNRLAAKLPANTIMMARR